MRVTARRFIRKMRGGAQAHMLEGDDGNFYVVKFQNNPQHRRILMNELIATELLAHLQISAPEYRLVQVPDDFLAANAGVHIQLGSRQIPVRPGVHFGSRFPGDPDRLAVYDFVPDSLLSQVANPEQFLGALVFDRWMANADARQAVFFRAELNDWLARPGIPPRKLGFLTLMIDHGFVFNGPSWDLPESAITGLYSRRLVYQGVTSIRDFDPWLSRILNFPESVIDRALSRIPPEWFGDDGAAKEEAALDRLLMALIRRQKRIVELVEDCRKAPGNPFPRWT